MRGHDDGPDADEGAIWILQRDTRQKNIVNNTSISIS